MLLGLPIMLLTAQRERERLSTTGTAAPTPVGLQARLLTWRGAMTGGALALGALVVGTGAFMTLRAMGVGPFATLVSSGALKARDKIVLADFANRTSDSTLALSITEALRTDLTESPVIRLAEGDEIASTLRLMERPPAQSIDAATARTIAVRLGAKAVLSGDVAPLGSGYVISARLFAVADGATLLAERETAADAAGIIPAVEALSRKLRERIGESLKTVRSGQPLEQVTTKSLAALQAYSEGRRLLLAGQSGALQFLEQAVALDSTFGMAWRQIGVIWWNRRAVGRANAAIRRAFALRDRMPPRESAHVTALYYNAVEDDLPKAIQAYERLLASWPDDITAINNLAVFYGTQGRDRDAADLYRRVLALRPDAGLYLDNLVQSLVTLDELDAADSLLDAWAKRQPDSQPLQYDRFRLAAERGNFARAYAIVDSVGKDTPAFLRRAQDLYVRQGRVREARPPLDPVTAAEVDAVLLDHQAAARQALDGIAATIPWDSFAVNDRPYGAVAQTYAIIGSPDRAEALLARQAREVPAEILRRDPRRAYAEARVALARGDAKSALDDLRRAAVLFRCHLCTRFDEGQAFEKLSEPDSAIAQYEHYVNGHDTDPENREFFLAAALRKLGEMYASKGERQKAVEYYGRLVKLWKDADPELQYVVRDARKQMAELSGEPPRR